MMEKVEVFFPPPCIFFPTLNLSVTVYFNFGLGFIYVCLEILYPLNIETRISNDDEQDKEGRVLSAY